MLYFRVAWFWDKEGLDWNCFYCTQKLKMELQWSTALKKSHAVM